MLNTKWISKLLVMFIAVSLNNAFANEAAKVPSNVNNNMLYAVPLHAFLILIMLTVGFALIACKMVII